MAFGASTLTFTTFVRSGTRDVYGNYDFTEVPTVAPGCRHRPLTFKEATDLQFDVATEYWRSTIPLHEYDDALTAALKAIPANAVIDVDGSDYQIIGGVRPHPDMEGRPFKMTIISQKQA